MTDPLRVLFFCGERSPWGRAHVEPLLGHDGIELVGVALATDERWTTFRRALRGDPPRRTLRHRAADAILGATRHLRGRQTGGLASEMESRLHALGVPILRHGDANAPDALADYRSRAPDVVLSAAYPQIFSDAFLQAWARKSGPGAYNSHPSLLPRCRGAHPVFWAIAAGETKTGGTIHVLTPELDAGGIVAQLPVEIEPTDGYHDLYARLQSIVPELVDQFAAFVRAGRAPTPQDDENATIFRNDRMIHHRLFWSEHSAAELERLVRAAHGSAFFWVHGTRVRVLQARHESANRNMTNDVRVPPGAVVDLDDGRPVVATRDGFLVLEKTATAPLQQRPAFEVGMVVS